MLEKQPSGTAVPPCWPGHRAVPFDAQDRLVMASVGLYPSDRFSHNLFPLPEAKTPDF